MQKAMIISCSDNYSYNVRTKYIEKVLLNKGYEVKFITADFDHRTKKKYDPARENIILVHVPKYKKNFKRKTSIIICKYAT